MNEKLMPADPHDIDGSVAFALLFSGKKRVQTALSSLWDGGITAKLGDAMNGLVAEQTLATIAEAEKGMYEQARIHFPDSEFAKS